jgi:hypothetical protein
MDALIAMAQNVQRVGAVEMELASHHHLPILTQERQENLSVGTELA